MLMIDSGHEKEPLGIFLVTRQRSAHVAAARNGLAAREFPRDDSDIRGGRDGLP